MGTLDVNITDFVVDIVGCPFGSEIDSNRSDDVRVRAVRVVVVMLYGTGDVEVFWFKSNF